MTLLMVTSQQKKEGHMALKDYQVEIELDTLYETVAFGGSEQLRPTVSVSGGNTSIYMAQEEPTGTPITDDMILNEDTTDLTGIKSFEAIPSFMYFTGTATKVILSGIRVKEVV